LSYGGKGHRRVRINPLKGVSPVSPSTNDPTFTPRKAYVCIGFTAHSGIGGFFHYEMGGPIMSGLVRAVFIVLIGLEVLRRQEIIKKSCSFMIVG
jgi:hypothetical protein